MKKTIIILAILLIIGIAIYYIVYKKAPSDTSNTYNFQTTTDVGTNSPSTPITQSPSSSAPTTNTPTTVTNTAPAPEASINIQKFAFDPLIITVKGGTKVTWTNNDTVSHTVTSDVGTLLNSPTLSPGQSFSFTFTDPGTIKYHCSIHPMMKGTIVVQ